MFIQLKLKSNVFALSGKLLVNRATIGWWIGTMYYSNQGYYVFECFFNGIYLVKKSRNLNSKIELK